MTRRTRAVVTGANFTSTPSLPIFWPRYTDTNSPLDRSATWTWRGACCAWSPAAAPRSTSPPNPSPLADLEPRRRSILEAAYHVLVERGYAGASTLEIATRARVSKRELYAEFGSKSGILRALIAVTAAR
jgi:hypothetical protein